MPPGDAPGRAPLVVRIFGGLEVSGPGKASGSTTTQSKRVALLAYLALARPRGLHRRDALLHLFWPDLDQSRARAALRQSIYYLRKSLDIDVFTSEGDETIGVDPDLLDCDALAFEDALEQGDLERALDLYRGGPFAGFHVSDVDPDLDDWFHATAERYRTKAADAARELAARDVETKPVRAAEWALRALRIDPEDESALRLRIRALDAIGDRIAAMKAYEAFTARLEEEYGIEPEAETRSLVEEIRARQSSAEADREDSPVPIPIPDPRRGRILPTAVAGVGILLVLSGWLAWDLTRAEEPGDDGGIRDPAPVAAFVEPQLGGLHDLRIVFMSLRDGNQELYAINADGTELERLTHTSAREWGPIWTPDGRILFTSDRGGNRDIYLMDGDGSNVRRMTDHPARESVGAISRDGSTIAFRSDRAGPALALYLMDADGSNVRLVEDGHTSVTGFSPAGDRLVFGSMRAAAGNKRNSEIFVRDLNRGGGAPVRLTHAWSYDDHPDWSPDGRKIAFSSGRHGFYNHEVYIMDPDGSDQTNLTRSASRDARPRWTPDGKNIVFFSDRAGGYDLYVMDADGSNVRRITREGGAQHDVRGPLPRPPACVVVNGSFEEVGDERLPPGSEAFAGVPGWRAHDALHVKGGVANSPDVFVPGEGVPDNRYGYQFPVHGRNYAGFATSGTNPVGATEALAAALKSPVTAGRGYELRAHVSNADSRADWNFLEVLLHSTKTGASLRVDTLRSSVDQTWLRLSRGVAIAPGDTNEYDELVFRGSYPAPKPEGYWYVDDVDVCPVD